MTAKKQSSKGDGNDMALVGVGLAAIAAGAYFFFGPDGKSNQKKMRGWMVQMKGEVLERIENAKTMSESAYNEIVNAVAKTYEASDKIPKAEIMALATELKKQWRSIKTRANQSEKTMKKPIRRVRATRKKSSKE